MYRNNCKHKCKRRPDNDTDKRNQLEPEDIDKNAFTYYFILSLWIQTITYILYYMIFNIKTQFSWKFVLLTIPMTKIIIQSTMTTKHFYTLIKRSLNDNDKQNILTYDTTIKLIVIEFILHMIYYHYFLP